MNTKTIGRANRCKFTHDQMLLRRSEKFRLCDEYRHDQTKQRRFELEFESRDLPESQAAIEGEWASSGSFALVAGHGSALFGRRAFSLIAPSDRAMFALDFPFWATVLRRMGRSDLLLVMRAAACGAAPEDIGISDRTFRRRLKKVEDILTTDPAKFRFVL